MNCNSNFCFKCRLEHGKTHDFINYKEKNYICKTHNRFYDSYCQTCKKNICIICYQEHLNHNIKSYGYMLPKTTEFSNSFINLGDKVNSLKKNIDEIINKLYKVKTNIIRNFDYIYLNNEILYNLKTIDNKEILNSIEKINIDNNDNNIINKFKNIMKMYEKMTNKNDNNIQNEINQININNDQNNSITVIHYAIRN